MKAFTLIEVIFVIVLVGILSIGAINALPDNTLANNTKFIYNKILEKKANALSFMADMKNGDENRTVCVNFDENGEWFRNDENYSKVKFDLSHRIRISSDIKTLCFDYLGRPYAGAVDLIRFNNLLHENVDVTVEYVKNNKNMTITIFPMTGNVEIK